MPPKKKPSKSQDEAGPSNDPDTTETPRRSTRSRRPVARPDAYDSDSDSDSSDNFVVPKGPAPRKKKDDILKADIKLTPMKKDDASKKKAHQKVVKKKKGVEGDGETTKITPPNSDADSTDPNVSRSKPIEKERVVEMRVGDLTQRMKQMEKETPHLSKLQSNLLFIFEQSFNLVFHEWCHQVLTLLMGKYKEKEEYPEFRKHFMATFQFMLESYSIEDVNGDNSYTFMASWMQNVHKKQREKPKALTNPHVMYVKSVDELSQAKRMKRRYHLTVLEEFLEMVIIPNLQLEKNDNLKRNCLEMLLKIEQIATTSIRVRAVANLVNKAILFDAKYSEKMIDFLADHRVSSEERDPGCNNVRRLIFSKNPKIRRCAITSIIRPKRLQADNQECLIHLKLDTHILISRVLDDNLQVRKIACSKMEKIPFNEILPHWIMTIVKTMLKGSPEMRKSFDFLILSWLEQVNYDLNNIFVHLEPHMTDCNLSILSELGLLFLEKMHHLSSEKQEETTPFMGHLKRVHALLNGRLFPHQLGPIPVFLWYITLDFLVKNPEANEPTNVTEDGVLSTSVIKSVEKDPLSSLMPQPRVFIKTYEKILDCFANITPQEETFKATALSNRRFMFAVLNKLWSMMELQTSSHAGMIKLVHSLSEKDLTMYHRPHSTVIKVIFEQIRITDKKRVDFFSEMQDKLRTRVVNLGEKTFRDENDLHGEFDVYRDEAQLEEIAEKIPSFEERYNMIADNLRFLQMKKETGSQVDQDKLEQEISRLNLEKNTLLKEMICTVKPNTNITELDSIDLYEEWKNAEAYCIGIQTKLKDLNRFLQEDLDQYLTEEVVLVYLEYLVSLLDSLRTKGKFSEVRNAIDHVAITVLFPKTNTPRYSPRAKRLAGEAIAKAVLIDDAIARDFGILVVPFEDTDIIPEAIDVRANIVCEFSFDNFVNFYPIEEGKSPEESKETMVNDYLEILSRGLKSCLVRVQLSAAKALVKSLALGVLDNKEANAEFIAAFFNPYSPPYVRETLSSFFNLFVSNEAVKENKGLTKLYNIDSFYKGFILGLSEIYRRAQNHLFNPNTMENQLQEALMEHRFKEELIERVDNISVKEIRKLFEFLVPKMLTMLQLPGQLLIYHQAVDMLVACIKEFFIFRDKEDGDEGEYGETSTRETSMGETDEQRNNMELLVEYDQYINTNFPPDEDRWTRRKIDENESLRSFVDVAIVTIIVQLDRFTKCLVQNKEFESIFRKIVTYHHFYTRGHKGVKEYPISRSSFKALCSMSESIKQLPNFKENEDPQNLTNQSMRT